MIVNIDSKLDGFSRYNGGWIKTITRLDKDYKNGYSLVGEFLPVSSGNIDLDENTLYLDCSINGNGRHKEKDYHLFRLIDGEIFTIQSVEDGGPDWAMTLWDSVEKELGVNIQIKTEQILNEIKRLDDESFDELMEKLSENDFRFEVYKMEYFGELYKKMQENI